MENVRKKWHQKNGIVRIDAPIAGRSAAINEDGDDEDADGRNVNSEDDNKDSATSSNAGGGDDEKEKKKKKRPRLGQTTRPVSVPIDVRSHKSSDADDDEDEDEKELDVVHNRKKSRRSVPDNIDGIPIDAADGGSDNDDNERKVDDRGETKRSSSPSAASAVNGYAHQAVGNDYLRQAMESQRRQQEQELKQEQEDKRMEAETNARFAAARAALAGTGDDGTDDVNADHNYIPETPAGWGPPKVSELLPAHRKLEIQADAKNPPFCGFCHLSMMAKRSVSGTPSGAYKRVLDWVHSNIHRMDRSYLCFVVQWRYLTTLVQLIIDDEEDQPGRPAGGPSEPQHIRKRARPGRGGNDDGDDDDDYGRESEGKGEKQTLRELGRKAGKYYWSLKTIYDHFSGHAPSERMTMENIIRSLHIQHEVLMSSGWYLRNPKNGLLKCDLRVIKSLHAVEDRLFKYTTLIAPFRDSAYI